MREHTTKSIEEPLRGIERRWMADSLCQARCPLPSHERIARAARLRMGHANRVTERVVNEVLDSRISKMRITSRHVYEQDEEDDDVEVDIASQFELQMAVLTDLDKATAPRCPRTRRRASYSRTDQLIYEIAVVPVREATDLDHDSSSMLKHTRLACALVPPDRRLLRPALHLHTLVLASHRMRRARKYLFVMSIVTHHLPPLVARAHSSEVVAALRSRPPYRRARASRRRPPAR